MIARLAVGRVSVSQNAKKTRKSYSSFWREGPSRNRLTRHREPWTAAGHRVQVGPWRDWRLDGCRIPIAFPQNAAHCDFVARPHAPPSREWSRYPVVAKSNREIRGALARRNFQRRLSEIHRARFVDTNLHRCTGTPIRWIGLLLVLFHREQPGAKAFFHLL